MSEKTIIVPFSGVVADPQNPRQAFDPVELRRLESSIKKNGIMTPLAVEKQKDGKYLLIDGERRYRASKNLKLKELPVMLMEPMTEVERLVARFNLQDQHSSWSTWEKANAVQILKASTDMKDVDVADSLGISRSQVEKYGFVAQVSKRTAQVFSDRKLPFELILEMGRISKFMKDDEEMRSDMEEAIIGKIENKVIINARELRKYRTAIMIGGKPIIEKIIKDKKYSATMASVDAGTNFYGWFNTLYSGCTSVLSSADNLKGRKHLVFTEALHNRIVAARKALAVLEDVDFEEGRKRTNRNPEV